jgi:septum formation protein
MPYRIVLASGSEIRQALLRRAGLQFDVLKLKIDEASIRDSLVAEGASPRDIADHLAEAKARKGSVKDPEALVIGCDQVLAIDGKILGKPETPQDARAQLDLLNGQSHQLLSAAVIYEDAKPIWRHVGVVKLRMRKSSDSYLDDYVARNWDSIRHSVGGYKLEEEGVRLFHRIDGDYFNVLGLPLLELLAYLTLRGVIEG